MLVFWQSTVIFCRLSHQRVPWSAVWLRDGEAPSESIFGIKQPGYLHGKSNRDLWLKYRLKFIRYVGCFAGGDNGDRRSDNRSVSRPSSIESLWSSHLNTIITLPYSSSGRLLDGVDGNGGLEEILSQCADMVRVWVHFVYPGSLSIESWWWFEIWSLWAPYSPVPSLSTAVQAVTPTLSFLSWAQTRVYSSPPSPLVKRELRNPPSLHRLPCPGENMRSPIPEGVVDVRS